MSEYSGFGPDRGMFWIVTKWLVFFAAIGLVARFVLLPLFVVDKLADRQVQKFDAETSKQAYDTSRAAQQGVQRNIARYCASAETSETEAGKKAMIGQIKNELSSYTGPLTDADKSCMADLHINY